MAKGAISLPTPREAWLVRRTGRLPEREEMYEENLANTLDRILAGRIREFGDRRPKSPREVIRWLIRWIRNLTGMHRIGAGPVYPNSPIQSQTIARIHSLPAHAQDALRRYFVFQEAEESICLSIGATPRRFRRFLLDATGYILMRQERMPHLKQKRPADGRQFPG